MEDKQVIYSDSTPMIYKSGLLLSNIPSSSHIYNHRVQNIHLQNPLPIVLNRGIFTDRWDLHLKLLRLLAYY